MPSEHSILRDALHLYSDTVHENVKAGDRFFGTWVDHKPLKRWALATARVSKIKLGSATKLFVNSHYRTYIQGIALTLSFDHVVLIAYGQVLYQRNKYS